ncbi:MAG: hypothetical protein FJ404_05455 [Verrucomicrobia bacterium]|nr:hypothetical protein [Verrucomicrobiota bacterium]
MKSTLYLLAWTLLVAAPLQAADKHIVLIAGRVSHGPGDHEFRAGSLLLQKSLRGYPGIQLHVRTNGWLSDEGLLDSAAAIVIYADGGGGHPAIQADRLKRLDALAAKGVGLGCMHYGVEVPKGDPGQAMHRWIGGYYEHQYSVNPMWSPEFKFLPDHPIARGVKPFSVKDEWYFNMRWGSDKVTPILVAVPSDDVRDGPYVYPKGPYPHIQEAKGRTETMMWAFQRPGGGRGFGFTGGHRHVNWGNDSFRKAVLNAFLWIAHVDVPPGGVESSLTEDDLKQNLDDKSKK